MVIPTAYKASRTLRMSLCTPVYLTVLRMAYLSDASRPHGDSVPGHFFDPVVIFNSVEKGAMRKAYGERLAHESKHL